MEFAETLTLSPSRVDDALFTRLRSFLDDPSIVELTLVVAAYNLTNRFNLALGVELEPMFEQILAGQESGH